MTTDTNTRWTLTISKETDRSVRMYLAERGLKKGDLSKFVEDAVRWRVFDQTLAEARAKVADVPGADMQAVLDEALAAVRAEKWPAPKPVT